MIVSTVGCGSTDRSTNGERKERQGAIEDDVRGQARQIDDMVERERERDNPCCRRCCSATNCVVFHEKKIDK